MLMECLTVTSSKVCVNVGCRAVKHFCIVCNHLPRSVIISVANRGKRRLRFIPIYNLCGIRLYMYGQLLTGLMAVIINGIVLDIRFAEMYKVYERNAS